MVTIFILYLGWTKGFCRFGWGNSRSVPRRKFACTAFGDLCHRAEKFLLPFFCPRKKQPQKDSAVAFPTLAFFCGGKDGDGRFLTG